MLTKLSATQKLLKRPLWTNLDHKLGKLHLYNHLLCSSIAFQKLIDTSIQEVTLVILQQNEPLDLGTIQLPFLITNP